MYNSGYDTDIYVIYSTYTGVFNVNVYMNTCGVDQMLCYLSGMLMCCSREDGKYKSWSKIILLWIIKMMWLLRCAVYIWLNGMIIVEIISRGKL